MLLLYRSVRLPIGQTVVQAIVVGFVRTGSRGCLVSNSSLPTEDTILRSERFVKSVFRQVRAIADVVIAAKSREQLAELRDYRNRYRAIRTQLQTVMPII